MAASYIIDTSSIEKEGSEADRLISLTSLQGSSLPAIMEAVDKAWKLASSGVHGMALRSPLEMMGFEHSQMDVILDMVLTRKRTRQKYIDGSDLFFTSEGLRWATPEIAAEHCARRLAGPQVVDVTCGQGGQVLSLSKVSDRVIAVDIDPLNCLVALMNCISRKISNVTIVNGDCFDHVPIGMAEEGCAIFCDPARPPVSVRRELSEMVPDPRKVLRSYGDIAAGSCFEVPPYISMDKVDFRCEAEYVSIEGRLNRLNLYTGNLYVCERSAVLLPGGEVLKGIPGSALVDRPITGERVGCYAYEVDPSVVRSDLTSQLVAGMGEHVSVHGLDGRRVLLVSNERIDHPFLKQGYRILAAGVPDRDLNTTLIMLGAGKVTLRYGIDPEEYWKVRLGLEENLNGRKKVQLFKAGGYLVLEKMEDRGI
ncbi:MAG: hypothetical protein JW939_05820 [Candidatus Thermoplasmatota archaeon]|nr:hypothetical protein [Candidatus Thermoplasmatota archaeon]